MCLAVYCLKMVLIFFQMSEHLYIIQYEHVFVCLCVFWLRLFDMICLIMGGGEK